MKASRRMSQPVSSRVSRTAAWARLSPGSRWPAGWLSTSRPSIRSSTSSSRPSRATTLATVTWGCQWLIGCVSVSVAPGNRHRDPGLSGRHGGGVHRARPGRPEIAPPPMYQVILLNDDYTPMDFVVLVLQQFFGLDLERATQVMLHVHTRGRGVCGVFTREVAESKVAQVNEFSRMNQHPLLCTMEKA